GEACLGRVAIVGQASPNLHLSGARSRGHGVLGGGPECERSDGAYVKLMKFSTAGHDLLVLLTDSNLIELEFSSKDLATDIEGAFRLVRVDFGLRVRRRNCAATARFRLLRFRDGGAFCGYQFGA